MTTMTRRDAMKLAGAALAGTTLGASRAAAQPAAPFLTSDIGVLKRVLVHSIVPGDNVLDKLGTALIPYAETDMIAAAEQQAALIRLLRDSGAEIVEVADALETAIEATRASGVFEAWVDALFPRLGKDVSQVTAATIFGRDPATQFRLGPDGDYTHLADDSRSTMWTRDSAFMTPKGLVMCNSASHRRLRENVLLRFLYAHSPLLDMYPIAFDAVEEGLVIEGGDAMVIDERTLFLGTGNRTDPRIAPVLARRLDMDVITVQTVEREFLRRRHRSEGRLPFYGLRLLFLHLDTYFTLVGPKHALAMPYVMEKAYAEDNPLTRFIRGARAETMLSDDEAKGALDMLENFGRVRLYKRGSGRLDTLGKDKLLDFVRDDRYKITYTGGPRPDSDEDQFRHFMKTAYPEQRRQASNIVQAAPGRVIAYAGNPATEAALKADGIEVETFEARELWAWHGGPHCLTQPLERA